MTRTKMYWKMVVSSLARRKARMITALLAIAMGATILSGLGTIYYDIPRQMGKEFRSYGANLIIIPTDSDKKISEEQIKTIKAHIPADKLVGLAPYIYENAKIHQQPYMIAATDIDGAEKNAPYWLIHGDWPKESRDILIGREIADNIGLEVGDTFVLNTPKEDGKLTATDFKVTGTVTTGGKEEELLFMSTEDIRSIVGNKDYDVVEASIEASQAELQKIADEISSADQTLTPQLVKRVTASQDVVLEKLQALVWIVSIVVLIIMMICVSTTMMAVITERRKEIGLKKALGASNKSVVTDFLGEGVALGILGGALGVVCGYYFANRVSVSVFAREVNFLYALVPVTVVTSVVITVVACLIPVRSAVDVEPALVLRGE